MAPKRKPPKKPAPRKQAKRRTRPAAKTRAPAVGRKVANPGGAPSKIDDASIRFRMLRAMAAAMPVKDACSYAGIDHVTHRRWMIRGGKAMADAADDLGKVPKADLPYATYVEAIQQAEARWKFRALRRVQTAEAWQAHMTLLERRDPANFSRRKEGGTDAEDAAKSALVELAEAIRREAGKPPTP